MKFLKKFKTIEEANQSGSNGLFSPHTDLIASNGATNLARTNAKKFKASFNNLGKIIEVQSIYVVTLTAGDHGSVSGGGGICFRNNNYYYCHTR